PPDASTLPLHDALPIFTNLHLRRSGGARPQIVARRPREQRRDAAPAIGPHEKKAASMTQHTVSTAGQTRRTSPAQRETAPRPEARPVDRTLFGDTVTVRRRWLRDTRSAEVTAHFAAENVHADARTAHLAPLRSALGRAFRGSTAPIELSAPVLLGGWWYIDRPAAADGALLTRVRDRAELRGPAGIPEIVPGRLLDGEEILVEDCRGMIGFAVSPDHRLLARAEAALGGCRVIVTEAATGELVDAAIEQAGPDLVFSADSRSLLHTR